MIDEGLVGEIIGTYQKHGWILRRVLLSGGHDSQTGIMHFDGVPIVASNIDAAWFSRSPKSGGVAWELRYLGSIAFALLENLDEAEPDFERALGAVERRLSEAVAAKISA